MNGRLASGKRKAYYAQDKGSYNISSYDALSAKNASAKQRSTTMPKPGAQTREAESWKEENQISGRRTIA